jgi:hypothetical protein
MSHQPAKPVHFGPMGSSADGKHFVNMNNRCKECGNSMPLPEKEGKCCGNCGTRVPTHRELKTQTPMTRLNASPNCPFCQAKNQTQKHCTECGQVIN